MRLKERLYVSAARILPLRYRDHLSEMLVYAGEKKTVEYWLGSGIVLGSLVLIAALLLPFALSGNIFSFGFSSSGFSLTGLSVIDTTSIEKSQTIPFWTVFWAIGLILFIILQLVIYLLIYFKVQDRAARVEKSLPDALQLMAANIRAGMTPFQAMKLSARKEFGPLSEEIEYATTKALGTGSFAEALRSMNKRVKSTILDRTMQLFASSVKAGGHLAQLLEELAKDIAATKALKKEFVSSTKVYTPLILFTVILGAPLLQAISIHFVKLITNMQDKASTSSAGFGMSMLSGQLAMTPEFLTTASIVMLIIITILATMLIGVIAEGKEKYGLRYAPIAVTGSLAVFFAAQYVVTNLLGG